MGGMRTEVAIGGSTVGMIQEDWVIGARALHPWAYPQKSQISNV